MCYKSSTINRFDIILSHFVVLDYTGFVKHFAGAICTHWTTENKTDFTRVSLDFRMIDGRHYKSVACENSDVYRAKDGYYSICRKVEDGNNSEIWQREGPLLPPDTRMGFPWTVKDWEKCWEKIKSRDSLFGQ
jgi:hypothetical protein